MLKLLLAVCRGQKAESVQLVRPGSANESVSIVVFNRLEARSKPRAVEGALATMNGSYCYTGRGTLRKRDLPSYGGE